MNTFILQDWRLFVNVLSYFSCPPALLPPGDLSQAPKREGGAPGGGGGGALRPQKGGGRGLWPLSPPFVWLANGQPNAAAPPGRPSVPPAARVAASMTPPSVSPSPAARSAVAAFAPGGRRFTGAGQRPAPCKTKAGAEGPCFVGAMRPRRPPAERPAPRQPYGEPPEKRAARLYLPYKIASAPYRAAIPARHTRCRNRAQRFSSTSGWNWTPSTSGPASTPSMVPSRVAAHWIRPGAKPLTR